MLQTTQETLPQSLLHQSLYIVRHNENCSLLTAHSGPSFSLRVMGTEGSAREAVRSPPDAILKYFCTRKNQTDESQGGGEGGGGGGGEGEGEREGEGEGGGVKQ